LTTPKPNNKNDTKPRAVLLVSYFFPPVGGAGVQRIAKFVKYLPAQGWHPVVLTALNPSVPVYDEGLLAEIPESVEIHRAKTLEPGYATKAAVSAATEQSGQRPGMKGRLRRLLRKSANLLLQPDPQILWMPAAMGLAGGLIERVTPAVIIASAPPFSSLLLGARLARRYKIPLLLDFRDEWDISNSAWENRRMGPLSSALQRRMQKFAIRSAGAIVATSRPSARALAAKAAECGVDVPVRCIYNGYDAAEFAGPISGGEEAGQKQRYRLAYVGTLWNLTSVAPLVEGIRRLAADSPALAAKLELVVAGRRTAEQERLLAGIAETPVRLRRHDYLDHRQALAMIRGADCLVLLLSDFDFAGRVVPGKMFEYMATGNRVLAIAPRGEVWHLLEGYPRARCLPPGDVDSIGDFLQRELQRFADGGGSAEAAQEEFDATRYERSRLTIQLAALLDEIAAS